jgi:hypothetical protein
MKPYTATHSAEGMKPSTATHSAEGILRKTLATKSLDCLETLANHALMP